MTKAQYIEIAGALILFVLVGLSVVGVLFIS